MTKPPPLAAVRAFEAVGRTGSVKQAAVELGVTSGAITQHVHALEAHLKRRLVQRSGRGIELTVWGRLYLPRLVSGFRPLCWPLERPSNCRRCSGRPSLPR